MSWHGHAHQRCDVITLGKIMLLCHGCCSKHGRGLGLRSHRAAARTSRHWRTVHISQLDHRSPLGDRDLFRADIFLIGMVCLICMICMICMICIYDLYDLNDLYELSPHGRVGAV